MNVYTINVEVTRKKSIVAVRAVQQKQIPKYELTLMKPARALRIYNIIIIHFNHSGCYVAHLQVLQYSEALPTIA